MADIEANRARGRARHHERHLADPEYREANRIRAAQWYHDNRERSLERERSRDRQPLGFKSNARRKLGITIEDVEAMLESQDGGCAVCGTDQWGGKFGLPCVDHDHSTGEVRGLLCMHCNVALGHFKDNPDRVIAAGLYLLGEL